MRKNIRKKSSEYLLKPVYFFNFNSVTVPIYINLGLIFVAVTIVSI